MSEEKPICIFTTTNSGEAEMVASMMEQAKIQVQRRAILEQGSDLPEERFYVPSEQAPAARAVLDRWLDARAPLEEHAAVVTKLLARGEPESMAPPNLLALILPPGVFIVCFLFFQKIVELSILPSLIFSLPLPVGLYFLIRKAQDK